MAKKKGIKYWKKKAWKEFSKFIRLRDAIETTGTKERAVCCTCGKQYNAFGVGCLQAGHFIPGRSNSVLIDETGVHAQCWNCNQTLNGNWVEYEKFMINKYGKKFTEEKKLLRKQTKSISASEWQGIYELYKNKFEELKHE